MVAAELASLSFAAYSPRYVALTCSSVWWPRAFSSSRESCSSASSPIFLSRTVLVGFLSGVGVQVALGELPGLMGLDKNGQGLIQQLISTFERLPQASLPSLAIAVAVLVIIVGFEKAVPRFPGALLAVAGMTAACAWFHWKDHGIRVVGEVPGGLPHLGLPDVGWSDIGMVLPISFSCFIIILAQSAATSRAYAMRYRETFNENVDLGRPRVGQRRSRLQRHLRGQRQPDQDGHRRRGGRAQPVVARGHGRGSS